KRLSKKARKGLRGWPITTIAFYGPNLSQATKVAVGIVPSENEAVEELRDWKVDVETSAPTPALPREILEFIEKYQVRSVAMTDGIIGCPHQEGSITKANGVQFASFGADEIALQGRGYIDPGRGTGTPWCMRRLQNLGWRIRGYEDRYAFDLFKAGSYGGP